MNKNIITRIGRLMAMPLAVAALVACNEENLVDNTQMDAVGLSVELAGSADVATRAATSLPSGDLKLCYGSIDGTVSATYTGSGSSWSSTTPLYWQRLTADNGSYPFYALSPADASLTAVPADQSTAANAQLADLLLASATPAYKSTIALNFQHALSMVEVNLTNGGGMTTDELSTATLTIDGLQTAYSVAGTTATAAGSAANGLKPLQSGSNFQFIAPAQELATGALTLHFTVTINGEPVAYTYNTTADHTLVAGKKTVFNITVSKTAVEVDVTVEDWTTNTEVSSELKIAITGTAATPDGDEPAFTSMTLWLADEVLTDFSTATSGRPLGTSHSYTKDTDGAWTSTSPIYLDEMTANSVIYATATNTAADAVTGLSDYLVAGPVTVQGGTAAIALRHGLAQMTVKLVKGDNFPEDIDNAEITTPAMLKSAAMATNSEGVLHFVARGTETVNYTVASEATHLIVPQTLAANSVFTVKLANNNTYEAKLAEAVTLAAGVNTTITLTLMPTKVGVSAAVTAWGEAAAAATVQLAGTSSEVGITGITEAGKLVLTYVQNGALTTTATTFSYDGSAWTTPTPLYWDEIAPAVPYTFAALFTPTNSSVEKDYLVGLGTANFHGAQVAMGTLTHAMAKMTITLAKGTNMTDDELAALTKQVTLTKSTAVAVTATGTADITMATETSDIEFTSGTAFYVAPQTLTDANTIVLTRANGNKYTIKLSELKDAAGAAIFGTNGIETGKHYAITLTVSETSVGISASIAAWTDVNGSGTVTPEF